MPKITSLIEVTSLGIFKTRVKEHLMLKVSLAMNV